jgi:hypothetical protein
MIRIPVTLDVHGLGHTRRVLRTINIINDGTGTRERGNYQVQLLGARGQLLREGSIETWRRARPVEQLVLEALKVLA